MGNPRLPFHILWGIGWWARVWHGTFLSGVVPSCGFQGPSDGQSFPALNRGMELRVRACVRRVELWDFRGWRNDPLTIPSPSGRSLRDQIFFFC